MSQYYLTVFEKNGTKLLDEAFEASNDEEAKQLGQKILTEKQLLDYSYRCTTSAGKLLLFQS